MGEFDLGDESPEPFKYQVGKNTLFLFVCLFFVCFDCNLVCLIIYVFASLIVCLFALHHDDGNNKA